MAVREYIIGGGLDMAIEEALREELLNFLSKSGAHVDYAKALKGFPLEAAGKRPKGVPYSAWQLLEHIRIAQADILEFVSKKNYKEKAWPENYWPKNPAPPSEDAWDKSLGGFQRDRKKLIALLKASSPLEPIAFADNKTLMREILLVVDHTAYHLGELVLLRRILGNWEA